MKDRKKLISIFCPIAAFILMVFVILEFRDNFFVIAVAGVVVLLSAYLSFDYVQKEEEEELQMERERISKQEDFWVRQMREVQKMQKEIYNIMKENNSMLKGNSNESFEWLKESLEQSFQLQKNGLKAIIKYNRENAKQIAEGITASLAQLDVQAGNELHIPLEPENMDSKNEEISQAVLDHTKMVQDYFQEIGEQIHEMQKLLSQISAQQMVQQPITTKEQVLEQESAISIEEAEVEAEPRQEELNSETEESVPISEDTLQIVEEPEENQETGDLESKISLEEFEDTLQVLRKELEENENLQTDSDSEPKISLEEFEDTLQTLRKELEENEKEVSLEEEAVQEVANTSSLEIEPKEKPQPVSYAPKMNPAPEHKMSQEEIAALIASMNN